MRRRVALLAVATIAWSVVAALPAGAGTTVSGPDKGNVVTITVPVDCVGCGDWKAPGGGDLAKHWEKTAEKAWNDAFSKYSYCNKYKFELDIKMKGRPGVFAGADGRHLIVAAAPGGDALGGTGWAGAPERTPGGDPGQRSPDGTRYFDNDGSGFMPADATETVIVHEFGHVLGLGDDRDDAGNVVPGRNNTMMVGGARGVTKDTKLRIDKNLVDRIGQQLVNLGKITCGQAWNGTLEQSAQLIGCTSTATSPAQFTVTRRDGRFEMTVSFTEVASDCPFPTANLWGSAPVTGKLTRNRLTVEGGPLLSGTVDRSGERVSGSYVNALPADASQTYTTTWDVRCAKACGDAVG